MPCAPPATSTRTRHEADAWICDSQNRHEETVMSMRVVHATRFGGPEVLVANDAPEPSPGRGRVVVEVAVAQVLFLDTQLRSRLG